MTEKRAIHIARHKVVQEANGHYFCPRLPTKYLEFWRMVLAALIKAKAERPVDKSDGFGDKITSCPGCDKPVINYYNPSIKPSYCMLCGQKLDWQQEPAREEAEKREQK